jgi:hypothetical protein
MKPSDEARMLVGGLSRANLSERVRFSGLPT